MRTSVGAALVTVLGRMVAAGIGVVRIYIGVVHTVNGWNVSRNGTLGTVVVDDVVCHLKSSASKGWGRFVADDGSLTVSRVKVQSLEDCDKQRLPVHVEDVVYPGYGGAVFDPDSQAWMISPMLCLLGLWFTWVVWRISPALPKDVLADSDGESAETPHVLSRDIGDT